MNELYDQIALMLHTRLVGAGPIEDRECALMASGVTDCIDALRTLFTARDQIRQVLGGNSEFDAVRFMQLAQTGEAS